MGSTSLTTDEAGDVVARQLYYPFGETRWVTGTLPTDFSYTGQREDAYTQLYEMGARWYDGRIGRWVSPDTIVPDFANPQNLSRYSYVNNRPLNFTDPSGHSAVGWDPGYGGRYDPQDPQDPQRYMMPDERVPPEVYWALMAYELGPRNEQGESILDDLFDPFPDLSDARNDQIASDFYHFQLAVLYEVYGGPEGLERIVKGACETNNCNNPRLSDDWWVHYSGDARFAVSLSVVKKSEATQYGYFLIEVRASPGNLANYEPWWLDELMRQYPRQLMAAQGHWVAEVYLPHAEEWQQYTYYFGGFRPSTP